MDAVAEKAAFKLGKVCGERAERFSAQPKHEFEGRVFPGQCAPAAFVTGSRLRGYDECAPTGIRTPVLALRGPRPGPLDDGGI